jgi:carotenoid cleavage dioxygenase-like enzyme
MDMGYPKTPDFLGLNEPVGKEVSLKGLAVDGVIPADIRGAFYRAVPDPAFPPKFDDDNLLSGDGMISKLLFRDDGGVDFDMKFVQTARHQAEVAAGRALFGRYRNPFTDNPAVFGIDRTVANTTPVWHAGKLLMTKEDGRPYRIDPHTLDTICSYDFDGGLRSETMTAHVRIDPATGEMFFYGYECEGLASAKVAYCIADKDGTLVREQWFDVPYCAMMHDFAITENYALFPIYPTTADFDRLKAGGEHWVHEMETDSWLGVMPRYGDVAQIKWFRGPKGASCYHMMNAHEDGEGRIHFDQCLSNVNAFPFIQRASGLNIPPWEMQSALTRWTVTLTDGSDAVTETVIGPPGDFPVIPAAEQGRPYTRGWMLTMNPDLQGPPVFGGPVGAMFNMLVRLDLAGGVPQSLALPPAHCFNEPVHVPSSQVDHDGWLLTIVDHQTGTNSFSHAIWIIDAGSIGAGPVARVAIPCRLRPQVHGWWVHAAALAAA